MTKKPEDDCAVIRLDENGNVLPGVEWTTTEEFMARGRVADCDCGLIVCVCEEARAHKPECRRRQALTCAVAIECELHGLDVCPTCDPCTCGTETAAPAEKSAPKI